MSEPTETKYCYLEARPHPWRKQLSIKGRNLTVWQLLSGMKGWGRTPEEEARDRGLPVEAVYEALDYYEKNKERIDAEAAEEKRWLKEHGWKLD